MTFKETIKFGLINDDDSTGDSGMMLVIAVQMTVKTALRIIHSHTMTLLKIQKMRMQEMRTLTKAWIQKAWPYMITCQLQGYSQPGMPVLFATVPQLKVLLFCFRNRRG